MKKFSLKTGLRKFQYPLLYLSIAVLFIIPPLYYNDNPFRYDWWWPFFDLRSFWSNLVSGSETGIIAIFSKNIALILGLFGLININTAIFFKILLILIHFIAGYGFFIFIRKRISSDLIAFIAGVIYAFTPYIFIRTIVGFIFSLIAYAILPLFLHLLLDIRFKKWWHYPLLGLLLTMIFAQIQAGLLTTLFLFVYSIISFIYKKGKLIIYDIILIYLFVPIVNLPWIIIFFLNKNSATIVAGNTATTLGYIKAMPHSLRNIVMLSDHQITHDFFYALAREPFFLIGFLLVMLVSFFSLFNSKNRILVISAVVSSALIIPFTVGPNFIFSTFYDWFFRHFPQIAVFRETYHLQFLLAFSFCLLFVFGLDWLWQNINNLKLSRWQSSQSRFKIQNSKVELLFKTVPKILFAGCALFIIAPYLTFDYAGYLKLQKIPTQYWELNRYFKDNPGICKKIYYPPGLGFVYFKGDQTPDASNSDILAASINIPYLDDGTTYSYLPNDERYFRNELVSQFFELQDNGEFGQLLREGKVDCLVVRADIDTKFFQATNLWREQDSQIYQKWMNQDMLTLAKNKRGLVLKKQFGENIYIYKLQTYVSKTQNLTSQTAFQQFDNSIIEQLPITDWAIDYIYYKEGWSRGRYDFWRKHLFTQLRQDFIYTDKQDSRLTAKIDQRGLYEVWTRHLTGGQSGNFKFQVSNFKFEAQKDLGEEKFVWKKLGDTDITDGKIEITNVSGENAIADIVLIKK